MANVFRRAGKRAGVRVQRRDTALEVAVIYAGGGAVHRGQVAPTAVVTSVGWQQVAGTPRDTADQIRLDALSAQGRAISIALQLISREVTY